jgi:hypothetical protein
MCQVMQELRRDEAEQLAKCKAATDFQQQMLYGQATLEASRKRLSHMQLCEECIWAETSTPSESAI